MAKFTSMNRSSRLDGLARMADVAEHPLIQRDYPVIAQSL